MKYDAFISYRHAALDLSVARKLHKALETYHIPKSVQKKTGKKRINRVFRDQEELPIGSDLNDNISEALREAEYLLVICSPDTPGSYWVSKEINTFIELHDREHVLAILISGEPWESFPSQLLSDSNGNAVEPLAADIRGANAKERDKKFKTEFLRLAAPLIGCTYDDLKQRHKERIIRRNITIGAVALSTVAVLGSAFGIYNFFVASRMKQLAEEKAALSERQAELLVQVSDEYHDKQINQSKYYAAKSEELLSKGYRKDAALVAIEALPSEGNDRPYVSRAENALSNALYTYGSYDVFRYEYSLEHNSIIDDIFLNPEDNYVTTTDNVGMIYVWDTQTWTCLATITPPENDLGKRPTILTANAGKNGIYVITDSGFYRYDFDGKVINTYSPDSTIRSASIDFETNHAILVCSKELWLLDCSDFKEVSHVQSDSGFGYEVCSSAGKDLFFIENSTEINSNAAFSIWDLSSDTLSSVPLDLQYISKMMVSRNDNLVVIGSNYMFASGSTSSFDYNLSVFDKDGKKLWSKMHTANNYYSASFSMILKTHSFSSSGNDVNEVIASFGNEVHTFDEFSGEELGNITLHDSCTSMLLSLTSPNAYISYWNGSMEWVNLYDGTAVSEYTQQFNYNVRRTDSINGYVLLTPNRTETIFVLKQDNEEIGTPVATVPEDDYLSKVAISTDLSYFIVRQVKNPDYLFYDFDGKLLYKVTLEQSANGIDFNDKECMMSSGDGIYYINPVLQTCEYVSYSSMKCSSGSYNSCAFMYNGSYAILYNSDLFSVVDLKNRIVIYEEQTPQAILQNAVITPDGKTLYCTYEDKILYRIDLPGGAKTEVAVSGMIAHSTFRKGMEMTISDNGKYLALHCSDEEIRILDLQSQTVYDSFLYAADSSFCMTFTLDNDCLILQKDNNEIAFRDLEKKEFADFTDASGSILSTQYDPEGGHIIIITDRTLLFINAEDKGLLCCVPEAVGYSPEKKCFMKVTSKELRTVPYKTYTELIEDARLQFPDAELTSEKKARYYID